MPALLSDEVEDAFARLEGSLATANANLAILGRHLLKQDIRKTLPAERAWMVDQLPAISQELYGISDNLLALHLRMQQHAEPQAKAAE